MLIDRDLYIIMTRPRIGYLPFLEICIEEGLPLVQLRDKTLTDRELFETAVKLSEAARGTGTALIINDRPDIAAMCGAGGFHLGQDDVPMEAVRVKIPECRGLITGISTHSKEQAEEAFRLSPDYIGFGPVYPTPTKEKPDVPVGTESVAWIAGSSPCPVVFIGGLFPDNIAVLLENGARVICSVRYLNESDNPGTRIRELRRMIQSYIS